MHARRVRYEKACPYTKSSRLFLGPIGANLGTPGEMICRRRVRRVVRGVVAILRRATIWLGGVVCVSLWGRLVEAVTYK